MRQELALAMAAVAAQQERAVAAEGGSRPAWPASAS